MNFIRYIQCFFYWIRFRLLDLLEMRDVLFFVVHSHRINAFYIYIILTYRENWVANRYKILTNRNYQVEVQDYHVGLNEFDVNKEMSSSELLPRPLRSWICPSLRHCNVRIVVKSQTISFLFLLSLQNLKIRFCLYNFNQN